MNRYVKAAVIAVVAFFCLAGVGWFALYQWNVLGDVEISTHGYIALVLGVIVTAALGIGLMTLLFYSARKGHDETGGR